MELIQASPIISRIKSEITQFTYVDVGCGYNGIDTPLHEFEEKLVAYGFDSNIAECIRLKNLNKHANIHYVAGVVKLDSLHPFSIARKNRPYWTHNPWTHLAVAHSLESIQTEKLSDEELNNYNLWSSVKDKPEAEEIYLDQFLPAQGINNIDLCKIDIDGPDFEVLHSLEALFQQNKVLSIVMEVNFFGSASEYDHTFHNVDRYLRQFGFDLYGLTVNKYAASSLPSPYYFSGPGKNISGRPYQGDALYILDPFQKVPDKENFLKLIAIYSLFDLPDWSAEVIKTYANKYLDTTTTEELLNLLTRQIQQGNQIFSDNENYMNAFNAKNSYFYSGSARTPMPTLDKTASQEINKLRFEINALKESTSWRVTAPFRYISDLLNKN